MLVIHFLCSKDNYIVCFVLLSCTYNQLKLAAEELTLPHCWLHVTKSSWVLLNLALVIQLGHCTQTLATTEEFFLWKNKLPLSGANPHQLKLMCGKSYSCRHRLFATNKLDSRSPSSSSRSSSSPRSSSTPAVRALRLV